jgi:hypothetical protein
MHATLTSYLKNPVAPGKTAIAHRGCNKSQIFFAIGWFHQPRHGTGPYPVLRDLRVSALFAIRAARYKKVPYLR